LPKIVKSSSSTENRSLKYSTVLTKVALRSLKVMEIVRTVTAKINHHLKCRFRFQQTYPQELRSYLMQ
jgi:hypothetical protein